MENNNINLDYVIGLMNEAMEAYKFSQTLFIKIDDKIQIEFVYATRAFTSLVSLKKDSEDYNCALADIYQAARHILNDSLDLTVGYASLSIKNLNDISKYSSVSDYYDDYQLVVKILKKFQLKISETRKTRGVKRIDDYLKMVHSEDYTTIRDFCLSVEDIKTSLKKARRKERDESKKWGFGILAAFLIAFVIKVLM